MAFKFVKTGYVTYKGNKKARIIDPNYSLMTKPMFIDATKQYENSLGEIKTWYLLKYNEQDILRYYFGENQIELIE